jgi:uncharacterized membrane protein
MNKDRKISFILMIIILLATLTVIYTIIFPPPIDNYTEFYILGADEKAGNYPTNLTLGQSANVTIGVVNHEHQTTNYMLRVRQNNSIINERNLTIKNGEKQELLLNFTANYTGKERIEFNLYKLPDQQNIYRMLYLQINVA